MRTNGLAKIDTPHAKHLAIHKKIEQQNARPGGDTEDKTFGKPFPNGRFYLLVFEINHLHTVDINGETAVRFLGENLRA